MLKRLTKTIAAAAVLGLAAYSFTSAPVIAQPLGSGLGKQGVASSVILVANEGQKKFSGGGSKKQWGGSGGGPKKHWGGNGGGPKKHWGGSGGGPKKHWGGSGDSKKQWSGGGGSKRWGHKGGKNWAKWGKWRHGSHHRGFWRHGIWVAAPFVIGHPCYDYLDWRDGVPQPGWYWVC